MQGHRTPARRAVRVGFWCLAWSAVTLALLPLVWFLFLHVLPGDLWPLAIYTMPLTYAVMVVAPALIIAGLAWFGVALVRARRRANEGEPAA